MKQTEQKKLLFSYQWKTDYNYKVCQLFSLASCFLFILSISKVEGEPQQVS